MDGISKEKWQAMTPHQKREHIWEYYKLPIIAAILVVAVIGWFISMEVNRVDHQMSVIMTDMHEPLADDRVYHPFLEEYGYEVYDQAVSLNQNMRFYPDGNDFESIDTNGRNYELLFGILSTGTQEIFFSQPKIYASCVVDGAMLDLSTVLPEALLEQYKDYFLFDKDEETGESYPCGIKVEENPWMQQVQKDYKGYMGIFKNCDNMDIAVDFVEYFLKQFDETEG